jgi:hypothetical protein
MNTSARPVITGTSDTERGDGMRKVNGKGFDDEQVRLARVWAELYDQKGWQPLPSRPDDKRPWLPSFAQWWEGGGPSAGWLWDHHPSGNIQVMCGRWWNLAVIDLDGEQGIEAFERMCVERGVRMPYTWKVTNDRTRGVHLWFTLPEKFRNGPRIPRRRLWGIWDEAQSDGKGGWSPRANIELLCDGCLVMAPPSVHPTKGTRYQFHRGQSPHEMRYPAQMPLWLLVMPSAEEAIKPKKKFPQWSGSREHAKFNSVKPEWLPCTPTQVKMAIHDKADLVTRWGVRLPTRKTNEAGWIKCHDFDRPDEHLSASFNPRTGQFWRPLVGTVCLFRLAVEMNIYPDWRAACTDLAHQYLPHLFRKAK